MSRAEKFIQDYTRNCSNEMESPLYANPKLNFYPWLTPEEARKAVEIAKEEVIEWIDRHWREYVWLTDNDIIHFGHWKNDLRQAMKDD